MEKINSYDVFDTLIARRFVNNDAILSAMEHRINISNFAFNRKQSDDGTKSLYEIYRDLANKGIIPSDKIMEYYKLEVSLEKHQIFGIKENIDKVQDGDLLISDMYFSGADILELVRFAGCDKQITIYQSNSDKRTGVLWDKLKNTNLINTHLGDNNVSDVENPKLRNIKAEHYPNAVQFTGVENYLYSKGMAMLGSLVREIRLKYNQQNIKLFELSNQLNLPWLLICCELLYRKHKDKNLVFLGRDCQLLYKVYNSFYENAYYVPFSRKIAYTQPNESVGYLKAHLPPDYVLVDISSTGATWEKICSIYPFEVEILIYSDMFKYTKEKPNLPKTFSYMFKNSVMGQTNEMVEILNCGDHGVIESIREHGGVYTATFGDNEMNAKDVKDIHAPIELAVEVSAEYRNLKRELSDVSDAELKLLFQQMILRLCENVSQLNLNEYYLNQEKYMSGVKNAQNH